MHCSLFTIQPIVQNAYEHLYVRTVKFFLRKILKTRLLKCYKYPCILIVVHYARQIRCPTEPRNLKKYLVPPRKERYILVCWSQQSRKSVHSYTMALTVSAMRLRPTEHVKKIGEPPNM